MAGQGSSLHDRTVVPGQPCPTCGQVHTACAGHKRSKNGGGPCGQKPADPTNGVWVCARVHGGNSGQVKAKAKRVADHREVTGFLARLGEAEPVDYLEALEQTLITKYARVQALRHQVESLTEQQLVHGQAETTQTTADEKIATRTVTRAGLNVWVEWLQREERDLITTIDLCHRVGIDERRVRLAEQQGQLVFAAITAILSALQERLKAARVEHLVLDAWGSWVADIVPRELKTIAAALPKDD